MFPQYQMIRDFDLYQMDYTQFSYLKAPVFHKDDFIKDTQDNQLETQNIISKTRSFKTKTPSNQTSFAQSIIEQHVLAFKKNIEKFIENCYPNFQKVQGKSLMHQIFQVDEQNDSGEQKLKNLILKDKKFFEQKEKKTFMTDLFYQQKLNEFLSTVCGLTNSHIALELIFIANLFWQSYVPKQEIGMTQDQINKFVQNILETKDLEKYMEKIEFLNLNQVLIAPEIERKEINEALKTFLKKFGVTILLVCEEYFLNPYSKQDENYGSMKRSLNFKDISNDEFSDDEDDMEFCFGHKKRNI